MHERIATDFNERLARVAQAKAKKGSPTMADQTPTIEWDEVPEPVSPTSPFEGLETKVLKVWMENSPSLRRAHRNPASRHQVENAARLAVHGALLEELTLRSQGMAPEHAQEWTRPAMWTPPTWPTTTPRGHRRRRVSPPASGQ